MVRRLALIDRDVARRCEDTAHAHADWPCHAGCSDCCRSLAAVPELTAPEWTRVRDAIRALPADARAHVEDAVLRRRERGSARPVVCPLLDDVAGLCRVYDARPVACRTYGFYADRDGVLGCERIAARAERDETIVWGNHESIEDACKGLGERRSLLEWLEAEGL
jgi:Fe-S-cluster containining protein